MYSVHLRKQPERCLLKNMFLCPRWFPWSHCFSEPLKLQSLKVASKLLSCQGIVTVVSTLLKHFMILLSAPSWTTDLKTWDSVTNVDCVKARLLTEMQSDVRTFIIRHQLFPNSRNYLKLFWRGCFIPTCSKRFPFPSYVEPVYVFAVADQHSDP